MKTAMVTGVTGMDGSHLTELLLEKGYTVVGLIRRSSTNTQERIEHINNENFIIEEADLIDAGCMSELVRKYQPDEFYNLAAQSHVATSFKQPKLTFDINAIGVLNILEAIRYYSPKTRFYQASTSEMFGSNFTTKYEYPNEAYSGSHGIGIRLFRHDKDCPVESYIVDDMAVHRQFPVCTCPDYSKKVQNEDTPFHPRSPYAVAKLAAHQLVTNYRESYGLHASCGILFNHEGERRGETFVTRKITRYIGKVAVIKNSILNTEEYFKEKDIFNKHAFINYLISKVGKLKLGNLEARRDWGHAEDYVRAMWLMLQQDKPDDYVVATGRTHTVKEFLCQAFCEAGFSIEDVELFIEIDPSLYRPAEVEYLLGDATKAREKLGWEPNITFENLVYRMIHHDIEVYSGKKTQNEKSKEVF